MSERTNSEEKWYDKFKEFENNYTGPFLQLLVDLWVPAFIAVLSIIFFSLNDQTLEIYRIFALNPRHEIIRIICSFISIFILSLLIWHSGRKLLEKENPDDSNSTIHTAFSWLPRILGCVPLVALFFGLVAPFVGLVAPFVGPLLAKHEISEVGEKLDSRALIALVSFVMISFALLVIYGISVSFRTKLPVVRHRLLSNVVNVVRGPLLFDSGFLLFLNFLSIIVVSIFTFPLVTDGFMRALVMALTLFLQYLLSWLLSRESASSKVNILRNPVDFFKFLFKLEGVKKEERKIIRLFLTRSTVVLLLVAYSPYSVSNPLASNIGPISVIALFLMVCVFWGSLLFNYGYATGIPFVIILIILAIAFSGLDWNDNHRLRELSSSQSVENSFKDLEPSFNEWIDFPSRKAEIKEFNDTGKPYPIYIASAQGGGIFAAYHAALTMARLQDSFPAFASHVFAISGVSGGSLGAAVFSSLVNDPLSETKGNVQDNGLGPLAQKAHYVLDHDFLSPLLSAGLFPDFVQRFLPAIPILSEGVDRARGIEYAFEQAWDDGRKKWDKDQKVPYDSQKDNPLRNSFYKHWKPEGTAPALVLNTTVVETGGRLVLSPFKIDLPTLKDIRTVACKKDNKDLDFPLSTAAILSARFPLVTPVGWFDRCDSRKDGEAEAKNSGQKARLADGGYFENSGISTAFEIGKKLEKTLEKDIKDKKIKVIYLAITDQPSSEIPKAGGFNEVLSPIGALYNSREARGLSAVAQVEYLVDVANAAPNSTNDSNFQKKYAKHQFRQFYLHDVDSVNKKAFSTFNPPLGWFLSKYSQDFIQEQIGYKNEKDCPDDLTNGSHNNCVFRSIKEELALTTHIPLVPKVENN